MSSEAEVKWPGSHAFQTSDQVKLIVVQERLTSSPELQNKLIFPRATTLIFKKHHCLKHFWRQSQLHRRAGAARRLWCNRCAA